MPIWIVIVNAVKASGRLDPSERAELRKMVLTLLVVNALYAMFLRTLFWVLL